MKKYIVRTPLTDRQQILIPEQAAGGSSQSLVIEDATTTTAVFPDPDFGTVTAKNGALIAPIAGIYLFVASAAWLFPSAANIRRVLQVTVDSVKGEIDTTTNVLNVTDQLVGLISLARGDGVKLVVKQECGSAVNATLRLSLALVAS